MVHFFRLVNHDNRRCELTYLTVSKVASNHCDRIERLLRDVTMFEQKNLIHIIATSGEKKSN